MALIVTHYDIKEAYLKAIPTTLHEEIVDDEKRFYTYVQYYIYNEKGGDILFVDSILVYFNPNESLYVQVYDYMINKYPYSKTI